MSQKPDPKPDLQTELDEVIDDNEELAAERDRLRELLRRAAEELEHRLTYYVSGRDTTTMPSELLADIRKELGE